MRMDKEKLSEIIQKAEELVNRHFGKLEEETKGLSIPEINEFIAMKSTAFGVILKKLLDKELK